MTEQYIPEPFGPVYPWIPRAAKFRRIPRDTLTAEQRLQYALAIEETIRELQRAALQRELPTIKPSCASGTWHNNSDGRVGQAVREKHARALLAYPDKVRRNRTPAEWNKMYKQAMLEKKGV
jgi:hypothetical protein